MIQSPRSPDALPGHGRGGARLPRLEADGGSTICC